MQALIYSIPNREQQNLSIGIVKPLNFPYNLFLNLKELSDPNSRFVYFFVYVIGEKKIVLWGVYDKIDDKFFVDGFCRYTPSELNMIVQRWKSNHQTYIANSVKDRPTEIINRELGYGLASYSEYVKNKYLLAYLDNMISREELENVYPGLYDEFIIKFEDQTGLIPGLSEDYDIIFHNYIEDFRDSILNYENTINRTDLSSYTLRNIDPELYNKILRITQHFYDAIKTGMYENISISPCPHIEDCDPNIYESGCELYFYGSGVANPNYYHPGDPNALL